MTTLVVDARSFAIKKHSGLFRPNKARDPYVVHLCEVSTLVQISGGSQEEIAAGWLHDVVEDTDTEIEEIEDMFGKNVATIVAGLTDNASFDSLDTLERKTKQARRVRTESKSVKMVKLADQLSNIWSVAVDPPAHWTRLKCRDYIAGSGLVVLECSGVSPLLEDAFLDAYVIAVRKYAD